MIKHADQRVGVFIDTQNMYYSARNLFNSHVSFRNIVEAAVAGRRLIRAIAYVVRTKTGEEQPFFEALVKSGIETRQKELQEFFGGAKKADWDVGIAVDAIRVADVLDVIILVSGDGDFVPLLEYLKHRGRQVEVVAFRETTSSKLVEAADSFLNLSDDPKKFLIRGGAERGRRSASDESPPTKRSKRTYL
ncbi:NYN domain-containing protein [Candidatus Uhrbacteria bacterium]|nr:NYN domain-containing protein [Candidatus Uhrbacteria bacterium]